MNTSPKSSQLEMPLAPSFSFLIKTLYKSISKWIILSFMRHKPTNVSILIEGIWLLQAIIRVINHKNFILYFINLTQFVYSNVIPQNGYNNGGIWNTFQRYSRSLVVDDVCESVEIISGPIYLKNQPKKDENSLQTEKLLVLK